MRERQQPEGGERRRGEVVGEAQRGVVDHHFGRRTVRRAVQHQFRRHRLDRGLRTAARLQRRARHRAAGRDPFLAHPQREEFQRVGGAQGLQVDGEDAGQAGRRPVATDDQRGARGVREQGQQGPDRAYLVQDDDEAQRADRRPVERHPLLFVGGDLLVTVAELAQQHGGQVRYRGFRIAVRGHDRVQPSVREPVLHGVGHPRRQARLADARAPGDDADVAYRGPLPREVVRQPSQLGRPAAARAVLPGSVPAGPQQAAQPRGDRFVVGQGAREEFAGALAGRVQVQQPGQRLFRGGVPAQAQFQFGAVLDQGAPPVGQPPGLRTQVRPRQARQGLNAPPQGDGRVQQVPGAVPVLGRAGVAGHGDQVVGPAQVHVEVGPGGPAQRVAAVLGDEDVRVRPEGLAQPGGVGAQGGVRGVRRVVAPQGVDQVVLGDDAARAQDQYGEERALLR